MDQICPIEHCTGCSMCFNICPAQCIMMIENSEGFLYPSINHNKCLDCGLCLKKCPAINDIDTTESEFYMAWHNDSDIIRASSSGGVFTALAHYVLRHHGVIYGAVMDTETRDVYHTVASDEDQLQPMRSSKYYQSNIKDVYKQVKENLNNHEYVLFTGTACQIAGLYAFLGNCDTGRLITADVLCHGVASKSVVDEYIKSKEKQFKKKVKTIAFRVKDMKVGWYGGGGTRMRIEFTDGTIFVSEKGYDTFFVGFNRNDFLRESCYSCKYCGIERIADFTMADFWGCNFDELPPEQKSLGVSLMLCNSSKSKMILGELKEEMTIRKINPEQALPYNRALREPQYRPSQRDKFFISMKKRGFDRTVKIYHPERFIRHGIKLTLRRVLPRAIAKKIIHFM